MAKVTNPRKGFNFVISFPGYPFEPILAQKVTTPDIDIEQTEHSEGIYSVKTGGRIKIGNVNIDKIARTTESDSFFTSWAQQVADPVVNGGILPDAYKRSCVIDEVAENGVTVIDRHVYLGVWPTKLNGKELNRMSSDNTVQSVELSVDLPEGSS